MKKEFSTQRRIAVIEKDKCRPKICNFLCQRSCPLVKNGKEVITIENGFPVINEVLCTGCGICVNRCPTKAIHIVNLEAKLDKPIHQYGKNGFRLYRLPKPIKGKVVALVGVNGIGKTTALKILSKQIVPNLGEEEGNWIKVLEYFRGKELHEFLEKIVKDDFKISYKPQHVELIPKVYKGKVRDLLEKAIGKENIGKIPDYLEIEKVLDKNVSELSGGDLQKVAIVACLMKDADLYFLDEPSSFLDVKQRFNIGRFIRENVKDNYLLIVEHDLALLDYLSDYVHVLFGVPKVYGVISNIKSSANGINEFLDGYIKDENVRFREKSISFDFSRIKEEVPEEVLFEYPSFRKTYPSFSLSVEGGNIKKGEIVGIVGENAIGKSTFVKVLAGIEKDDENKIKAEIKVSYKPQYVFFEEDVTVGEFFSNREVNKDYLKELRNLFSLETIWERSLKDLSGGEKQVVMCSYVLSVDADLYFLDEPSAFLDIEQRLKLAKAIRRIISEREKAAFVVDHDLLFVDALSDELILFKGIPDKEGNAGSPRDVKTVMNEFLKMLDITYRRDKQTKRPRINKPNSQKDKEQKEKGNYYGV